MTSPRRWSKRTGCRTDSSIFHQKVIISHQELVWDCLDRIGFSILLVAHMVKSLPAMWETWVRSLGWEDTLEKGMATHSSILVWRIPWTEESSKLQSMGSQRVGQDWTTNTFTFKLIEPLMKLGWVIRGVLSMTSSNNFPSLPCSDILYWILGCTDIKHPRMVWHVLSRSVVSDSVRPHGL